MLNKVFDFQRSLMEKLAPVEQSLGYTPPRIPLDFTQRAHQDWFRLMSWYLVEEISEAVHATPEELPEELADCLHFAVELCILADVTPEDLQPIFQMDLFDDIPAQFQLIDVGRSSSLHQICINSRPYWPTCCSGWSRSCGLTMLIHMPNTSRSTS